MSNSSAALIAAAKSKLDEAEFFLQKLWRAEHERFLDRAEEEHACNLSAFLAATRSAVLIATEKPGWAFIDSQVSQWDADDRELYRTFTKLRNASVHEGESASETWVDMVPEHELPFRQPDMFSGGIIRSRLPGTPPNLHGIRRFGIRVGSALVPAHVACAKHLQLTRRIVEAVP